MSANAQAIYEDLIEAICEEVQTHSWMYDEYQEYILNNCGGDCVVLDDNLPDFADDGYLLEDFAETLLNRIENNSLEVPARVVEKMAKYKDIQ